MRLLKRFIPCLLVVLCVFTITGCKTKETYKYPNEVPTLSNEVAEKVFMSIGDKKYTNGEVYNRLLQGYGLQAVEYLIDKELPEIKAIDESTEEFKNGFDAYVKTVKYGTTEIDKLTAEELEEADKQFVLNAKSEGLLTDDADKEKDLHYLNVYRLDYKRYVYALEQYTKEINEANKKAAEEETDPFFKDADYVSYFTANYKKTYKLIYVTFDSAIEAKAAMKAAGVDLNSIAGEWLTLSGDVMSAEKLKDVFTTIYNNANGTTGAVAEKEYTSEDIAKLGSTVDSRVSNLSTDEVASSYTHGPVANSGRYFLVLATEESKDYVNVKDATDKFADSDEWLEKNEKNAITKLTDKAKEKLFSAVVKNSFDVDSSKKANLVNRFMYELRQANELEIFAEGVEIAYKTAFNKVYSSLSITDYKAFAETKNTSKTVVAKTKGTEVSVDKMFDYLGERYGALLGLLFVQDYIILTSKFNKVIDYKTLQVLDEAKYAEYVKEDITSYKEAFEEGNFEASGFPKAYGWNNFLTDYIGLNTDAAIVTDYNGSLYNDVLDAFKKDLYTATAEDVKLVAKDVEGVKIWFLEVEKWNKINDYATNTTTKLSYNTGVAVVDENVLPKVSVAWKESDLNLPAEEIKALTKNGYYGHFVLNFKDAVGVEKCVVLPQTVDQVIYEEYDRIYDKSFSATAAGLYVYYDKDLDGKADEVTEAEAVLAKALSQTLWAKAKAKQQKDIESKITNNLNAVVREYYTSTLDSVYGEYKKAGIRINVISGASYSQSTNADEAVLDLVEKMYQNIVDYKNKENAEGKVIGQTITGQNLETGYRYIRDHVVYYVTAYDFADYDSVFADNGYYTLAVTKATTKTTKYLDESKQTYPSIYQYDQSLIEKTDDREITISSAMSTRISTYYKPALNNLLSTNYVNRYIMSIAKDLMSSVTFTENNEAQKAALQFIIDEAYNATNVEE